MYLDNENEVCDACDAIEKRAWLENFVQSPGPATNRLLERLIRRGAKHTAYAAYDATHAQEGVTAPNEYQQGFDDTITGAEREDKNVSKCSG